MMESVGVLVPAEHIAKVIGKAGAGLRQIRESSGCKLQVHASQGDTGESRRVDLSGSPGQIAAGFQILASKAAPDPGDAHSLLVPAERAGQIVGRGGENLRRVREACHVRVQLEREPAADAASGRQERLLKMQGDPAQLGPALRMVLGTGQPGGGAGGMGFPAAPMAGPGGGMAAMLGGMPAMGMGMGQVRAASADPKEVQIHFTIPSGVVGAIIGKGGAQIKQTATTAGCRVSMTTREGFGERRACIQGTYEQCDAAQRLLHAQIAEASQAAGQLFNEVSVIYFVRKETAGAVIGKQGATLKSIRETTGAKIQLAREEEQLQRACTISGPFQNVVEAERMIYDVTQRELTNRAATTGAPDGLQPPNFPSPEAHVAL